MRKPTATPPHFSDATLKFLIKANRQRNPNWLDRNREEYEEVLQKPLTFLAKTLKTELASVTAGYHFPQKGLGRLKRPAHRVKENGGSLYKDWMSYSARRPSDSRFDHNPSLFFLINPDDQDDPMLIAGGLYMPSSRQLRSIREAIADDASAFDSLFADKEFRKIFKGGFSRERTASRPPRGFDPQHPRLDWLKLQGYFVWRGYSKKEFSSPKFPLLVAKHCRQIVRLNELLEKALQGRLPKAAPALVDRFEILDTEAPQRPMDF